MGEQPAVERFREALAHMFETTEAHLLGVDPRYMGDLREVWVDLIRDFPWEETPEPTPAGEPEPQWTMAPPCRGCSAWPDTFWIVQGTERTPDGYRRTSFAHQPSDDAAREQLAKLQAEHPEITEWQILECAPVTRIDVVHAEHATPEATGA
jgi:hypothetical protein